MPPKQRITREMILERSFEMFCRDGMDAVNARSVAKALNCSTQPIFSYYAGMDDLKDALEKKAKETFESAISDLPGEGDPIVNICMAYVKFAALQPCLFKYLFMRSKEDPAYKFMTKEEVEALIESEGAYLNIDREKADKVMMHMCVYTHGYASMFAGGQFSGTPETIALRIAAAHKYLLMALNREE